jgi:mono/diheme cytochrome c family protein
MTRIGMLARGAWMGAALLLAACGQDAPSPPSGGSSASGGAPSSSTAAGPGAAPAAGDPQKGRQIWLGNCVACHATDPAKDGPLGPAVAGSSRELVEARVLRGEYPSGYTPKRPSKVMPPRPDLAPSVPDLAAYLSQGR